MSTTVGVLLLLAIVSLAWSRPRAFVVRPGVPAFSNPPQPMYVFLSLAFLIMATGQAGNVIRDWGSDPFLSEQLPNLMWAVLALLYLTVTWRGQSVQLRPDGLWQPGIIGWLVVPWEAAPTVPALPPAPNANIVPLAYGRPDLVRRDRLYTFRKGLHTSDIEPWLLTAAISHYVEHPEHRAAIGTGAEYDRLRSELHDPFSPLPRTA